MVVGIMIMEVGTEVIDRYSLVDRRRCEQWLQRACPLRGQYACWNKLAHLLDADTSAINLVTTLVAM